MKQPVLSESPLLSSVQRQARSEHKSIRTEREETGDQRLEIGDWRFGRELDLVLKSRIRLLSPFHSSWLGDERIPTAYAVGYVLPPLRG